MAKLADIMLFQLPERYALIIEKQADMNTFGKLIGESFERIGNYLNELGAIPSDIPFVEYPMYNDISEVNIGMIIGMSTAVKLPAKNEIKSVVIPSVKAVGCIHKGNYKELAGLYNEMAEWIKENGFEGTGSSIEHYYSDPNVPEEEQVTRIIMPLK